MGRYLTISIRLKRPRLTSDALAGAFACDAFRPAALGGIGSNGSKQDASHWYVNGWGLEHFACRYAGYADTQASHTLHESDTADSANRSYARRIFDSISIGSRPTQALSPHETADQLTGITFLASPELEIACASECDEAIAAFPQITACVYGCFHLEYLGDTGHDATKAFRFLDPDGPTAYAPIATPFVSIAYRAFPSDDVATLAVFSESTVWLRSAKAINGRVGKTEADLNLLRLRQLVQSLIAGLPTGARSIEMLTDGRPFIDEEQRLKRAIFDPD